MASEALDCPTYILPILSTSYFHVFQIIFQPPWDNLFHEIILRSSQITSIWCWYICSLCYAPNPGWFKWRWSRSLKTDSSSGRTFLAPLSTTILFLWMAELFVACPFSASSSKRLTGFPSILCWNKCIWPRSAHSNALVHSSASTYRCCSLMNMCFISLPKSVTQVTSRSCISISTAANKSAASQLITMAYQLLPWHGPRCIWALQSESGLGLPTWVLFPRFLVPEVPFKDCGAIQPSLHKPLLVDVLWRADILKFLFPFVLSKSQLTIALPVCVLLLCQLQIGISPIYGHLSS